MRILNKGEKREKAETERLWAEWDKEQEEMYKFKAKMDGTYPHQYY